MTDVLNRMIRRQQPVAADAPLTASRAIKLSVTRAAQDSVGLVVDVTEVAEDRCDLAGVTAGLSPDMLVLALDRAETGIGLVACDASLIAATLEAMTTGAVMARPAPLRAITDTDVHLVRPLLQGVLDDLALTTPGTPLAGWATECVLARRFADARDAGFALQDGAYHVIRVTLSDQKTDRTPGILIALPDLAAPRSEEHPPPGDAVNWADRMRETVLDAPARLDVVAHRMQVPLHRLTTLSIGDRLTLTGFSVGAVRVEAPGGQLVAKGRLGQMGGRLAVRIENDTAQQLLDLPQKAVSQTKSDTTQGDVALMA